MLGHVLYVHYNSSQLYCLKLFKSAKTSYIHPVTHLYVIWVVSQISHMHYKRGAIKKNKKKK